MAERKPASEGRKDQRVLGSEGGGVGLAIDAVARIIDVSAMAAMPMKFWRTTLAVSAALVVVATISMRTRDGEAVCGGRGFPIVTAPNGASPYVALSAGGAPGLFLFDYGATQSSISAQAFGAPEGALRDMQVSLPGIGAAPFIMKTYKLALAPPGGQRGVIGTDLLSTLTVQFTGASVYIGGGCEADVLKARGLLPISQAGFFGPTNSLKNQIGPNVPVMFLRFGDVHAFAQIDTGYDDIAYSHSIDINRPLFERLIQSQVDLERVGEIDVATCEGQESRTVYAAKRNVLIIENERADAIARVESFYLILKPLNGCGGIAAMVTPAAQLGASFLTILGTVVFDPHSGAVWLKDGTHIERVDVAKKWPHGGS